MPTLAQRIDFAEKYVTNKEHTPWSLKGREWVRDQFWRAADGYKLWRPQAGEPCDGCKDEIGSIIEHPDDNHTRHPEHRFTGCVGLDVYPIIVTLLNLIRQDGKTFNTMAMALADMALGKNTSIALIAASEDQVKTLFDENYVKAVEASPKLNKRFDAVGLRLACAKTNSFLEALPASSKSVTGRTRRKVLIDEARDVPSEVAWALIPAIQAMSGIECPRGHVSRIDPDAAAAALNTPAEKCTACGERLQPFFGRVIATSSSGVAEDDDEDYWFRELIEQCEKEPSPYVHVFRSNTPINPAKSPMVANALLETFGRLESMKHYVHADMTNEWTRKDDGFITKAEVDRCIDKSLRNLDECADPCVGFLDTSDTGEKTSLVMLASDPIGSTPWERVYTPRIDWWSPADMEGGIINEHVVEERMIEILTMFTSTRIVGVDTRGRPWAMRLVKKLRTLGFTFVEAWDKSTSHESDAGWSELGRRIRSMTVRLIDDPEMRREFRGLKVRKREDKPDKVTDKNRRKSHKDITESLAISHYLAALERLKRRSGLAHTREVSAAMQTSEPDQARATLARLATRRPITRGLGPNSY
jgi:hypothetical protein